MTSFPVHFFVGSPLTINVDGEDDGRIISIYGLNENLSKYGTIRENDIDDICKKFFSEYSEILGVNSEDLKTVSIRLRGGKYYVHCQQQYKDVSVDKCYLSFVIDQNCKTNKILCSIIKDINLNVNAGITQQDAESVAIKHFLDDNQISSYNMRIPAQLLIMPNKIESDCNSLLVYKVVLIYEDEYRSINNEYFIDANTAKIFKIEENWRDATLSGSLRLPYYQSYNSGVDYVYCGNTDFEIYNSLGGEEASGTTNSNGTFSIYFNESVAQYYFYASIGDTEFNQWCYTNYDDPSYFKVQGTFNWFGSSMTIYPYFYVDSSCLDYDYLPCNVYYHVNKMHDYFTGSPFNFSDMNFKMYSKLLCSVDLNGKSHGTWIEFGEEGGISWAKSASCINHEYSHCVIYHIYDNSWIGNESYNQPSAMDEGFPDYFDCAYRNDDVHCEGLTGAERQLSNSYQYNSNEDWYWNSQVISGACWDVRSTVTDIDVDLLVFNALFHKPYTFSQFLDCILEEDDDPVYGGNNDVSNGTPHLEDILQAFYIHQIYPSDPDVPPAAPLNLSVGEQSNHPYLTWDANPEPDLAGYHVYRKLAGEEQYSQVTAQPCTTNYFLDIGVYTGSISEAYYYVRAIDNSSILSGLSNIDHITVNYAPDKKSIEPDVVSILPGYYALDSNFPNPFNPVTQIQYQLPEASKVHLSIYNMNGQLVEILVNEYKAAGFHAVQWDASKQPSGVYLYRFQAGEFRDMKKCILIK